MKYLIEMQNGRSYFVDSSKPESQTETIMPEVGWHPSFFMKNKDFRTDGKMAGDTVIGFHKNKGFAEWNLRDDFGTVIARFK